MKNNIASIDNKYSSLLFNQASSTIMYHTSYFLQIAHNVIQRNFVNFQNGIFSIPFGNTHHCRDVVNLDSIFTDMQKIGN